MTIHALRLFLLRRGMDGQSVMLKALNALQGAYYLEIASRDKSQETFVYGWFKNRVEIGGGDNVSR